MLLMGAIADAAEAIITSLAELVKATEPRQMPFTTL